MKISRRRKLRQTISLAILLYGSKVAGLKTAILVFFTSHLPFELTTDELQSMLVCCVYSLSSTVLFCCQKDKKSQQFNRLPESMNVQQFHSQQ